MAHKLGLQLGQITQKQYDTLDALKKAGDTEEYERLETQWGTTRSQLEAKYGKATIAKVEIRTQKKTRKKYPIRTTHRDEGGVDAGFDIHDSKREVENDEEYSAGDAKEKGLWDTDTDDIL